MKRHPPSWRRWWSLAVHWRWANWSSASDCETWPADWDCKRKIRQPMSVTQVCKRDKKSTNSIEATYRCKCLKKWLKLKSKSVGWVLSERFEKEEKKACDSNEAASRLSTDTLSAAHKETIQMATLGRGVLKFGKTPRSLTQVAMTKTLLHKRLLNENKMVKNKTKLT